MTEDHKVIHCVNCPEVYCPDCDFPSEFQDLAHQKPGLCPLCLETNEYFLRKMRERYQNV